MTYIQTLENMRCPQCNEENQDIAQFCKNCGHTLAISGNQQPRTTQRATGRGMKKIIGLMLVVLVIGVAGLVGFKAGWFSSFHCGTSEVKDASGNTYGTVLVEDGRCWLDRNLGASRVATSPTDEASYGWYFQWGRGADGHQIATSDTTYAESDVDEPGDADFVIDTSNGTSPEYSDWRDPQNNSLWQGVDGTNNPCPAGFRVPTQPEWGLWAYSANITQSADTFSSNLKLPLAGHRWAYEHGSYTAGDVSSGDHGYYWSSSLGCYYSNQAATSSCSAYSLHFAPDQITDGVEYHDFVQPNRLAIRIDGFPVRCIKD